MVLTENTYLEPVLNWTEVATRVSGCHECTEKLTSEGLGRSADRNGPIPYFIHRILSNQRQLRTRPVSQQKDAAFPCSFRNHPCHLAHG